MRIADARSRDVSMSDRIVLTMPTDDRFRGVGTLVVGGVGARLELPYEQMDDLQLALLSALDAALDGDATLEIDADAGSLTLAVGPLRDGSSTDEGLRLVLSRLVDEVEHQNRGGAEWVALRLVPRAAG
jgi:hypothetical protein